MNVKQMKFLKRNIKTIQMTAYDIDMFNSVIRVIDETLDKQIQLGNKYNAVSEIFSNSQAKFLIKKLHTIKLHAYEYPVYESIVKELKNYCSGGGGKPSRKNNNQNIQKTKEHSEPYVNSPSGDINDTNEELNENSEYTSEEAADSNESEKPKKKINHTVSTVRRVERHDENNNSDNN